jgi:hypothetical protein
MLSYVTSVFARMCAAGLSSLWVVLSMADGSNCLGAALRLRKEHAQLMWKLLTRRSKRVNHGDCVTCMNPFAWVAAPCLPCYHAKLRKSPRADHSSRFVRVQKTVVQKHFNVWQMK